MSVSDDNKLVAVRGTSACATYVVDPTALPAQIQPEMCILICVWRHTRSGIKYTFHKGVSVLQVRQSLSVRPTDKIYGSDGYELDDTVRLFEPTVLGVDHVPRDANRKANRRKKNRCGSPNVCPPDSDKSESSCCE